ncbi:MAG TPA: LCP family protein [Acidimicrobiales bacterium]|jgi:LCP family protein required for cell wall assembly
MTRPSRNSRRSWLQRILLGLGVIVVLGSLTGAGGAVWFMRKIGNIERINNLSVDAVPAGEPSNYLVVGSDTRANTDGSYGEVSGQRSDTIMIVRLDPETKQAAVLSLPRDLMVPIAGRPSGELDKLNSAYAESHQTLVDTIRLNFGIEVNHYVVVDFVGFQRLVDAVGGVPFYLDRAIKDDNSGLFVEELGCVTLGGDQALAYARSRHLQYMTPDGWSREDPIADLGRIQRQQVFIRTALAKVLGQIKHNPLKLTELINIGVDSVSLDPETDPFDLADQFSGFDMSAMESYSLPVVDLVPEVSVTTDTVHAEPILNIFRGLDPSEVAPGLITVNVLNGTGTQGQANDAAAAFQAVGFTIGERSNFPNSPLAQTTVFHRSDEENLGLRVARHITGGAVLAVDDVNLSPGQVTVATGTDFTTVHMQPTPLDQMPNNAPAPAEGTTDTTVAPPPPPPPDTTPTTSSDYTIGAIPDGVDCG